MSSLDGNAGSAAPVAVSRPWWYAVPIHLTPVSDGAPILVHSDTDSGWSAPARVPVTQSTTFAPVANWGAEELSRTLHGSCAPRGLSSVKSLGVPRSSNASFMSKTIDAAPPAQVSRSSG